MTESLSEWIKGCYVLGLGLPWRHVDTHPCIITLSLHIVLELLLYTVYSSFSFIHQSCLSNLFISMEHPSQRFLPDYTCITRVTIKILNLESLCRAPGDQEAQVENLIVTKGKLNISTLCQLLSPLSHPWHTSIIEFPFGSLHIIGEGQGGAVYSVCVHVLSHVELFVSKK